MKRAILVLVCLLALSGCDALSEPSGTATETLTPADVPTQTPVQQIAPGVTTSGVEQVSVLAAAHNASLQNRSYTRYVNETALYVNGTVRAQFQLTARVTADRSRISITVHEKFPPSMEAEESDYDMWATGDRVFTRLRTSNETLYRTSSRDEHTAMIPSWTQVNTRFTKEFSASDMHVGDFQVTDGEKRYVLTANGPAPMPGRISEGLKSPAPAHARATIGPQGRIHSYLVRYRTTTISENTAGETPQVTNITVRAGETVRFDNIGTTTVERPSWYENMTEEDR